MLAVGTKEPLHLELKGFFDNMLECQFFGAHESWLHLLCPSLLLSLDTTFEQKY